MEVFRNRRSCHRDGGRHLRWGLIIYDLKYFRATFTIILTTKISTIKQIKDQIPKYTEGLIDELFE